MAGEGIKSINGAAGTVIRTADGQQVQDPQTRRPATETPAATKPVATDTVEQPRPDTGTNAPLEARVAELERQLAAERAANQEQRRVDAQTKADQAKAQREEGWFKKGLMDILMLFLRMFFPIISLISLVVRVLRIAYKKFIKGEKIDWKREGMLLLADLAGAAPMVGMLAGPVGFLGGAALGGVISAGIHGAVKVTSEDKDDMLGWEKQEPSGLRVGWEKLKGLTSETYAAVTGKERPSETRQIEEREIDTRTVAPGEVPVA